MVQFNKLAKYGAYLLAKAACSQADFSLKSADKLSDDFLGFLKLNLLQIEYELSPPSCQLGSFRDPVPNSPVFILSSKFTKGER